MNFQQLRSVREAARGGFNLTEVAAMLCTSQPGVSRQIRELEDELGVTIFARSGKRLTGLTEPGYALPHAVRDFRQLYPQVRLNLHQGSPGQVAEMLLSGEADIGIATEALAGYPALAALPCYRWTHSIVVPPGHPLLDGGPPSLERLAAFPLITYDRGYTGRSHIDQAFARAGLRPDHLFAINLTRLAVRRGGLLRGYAFAFIETFAPGLSRAVVEDALHGEAIAAA